MSEKCNYIDPLDLEEGNVVRWVHPKTEKVYRFEVIRTDFKSDNQPLMLELISDIKSSEEVVSVTPFTDFHYRGCMCWPFSNLIALKGEYGELPDVAFITLDELLPDSDDAEDAENAEDAKLSEVPVAPVAPIADLKVPSITELQEIIYTSKSDFGVMVTKALAKAIKQGKTYAELPPVLIEMHKEELEELGYEVRFSAIYWDFLD